MLFLLRVVVNRPASEPGRSLRPIRSMKSQMDCWDVELDGRPVAVLTDGRYYDMFWGSYLIQPLTEDPKELQYLYSEDFWHGPLVFRSRKSGRLAAYAFPSGEAASMLRQSGRVVMRGLYVVEPFDWLGFLVVFEAVAELVASLALAWWGT
jgi:hypothetical protein